MVLAVIPARYASTRLPGKPLADIGGKPMIVRVWERVARAPGVDRVVVATDDARIADAVRAAGGDSLMTGPCESGTDRVAIAARELRADRIVNVQGDEPFVDPDDVGRVVATLGSSVPIVTASAPYVDDPAEPSRVKVVSAEDGRALYFSRAPIPFGGPWRLHVGLYAYTGAALAAIAALPPSPLERIERLEQLRWLEAGWTVRVVPIARASLSVDTLADLERARSLARAESPSGDTPA